MKRTVNTTALLLGIVLLQTVLLTAQIISYQAPGIAPSGDFQLWANGQDLFTAQAGSPRHGDYSFSTFDFSGSVTLRVRSLRAIKWLDILPSSLRVEYLKLDDYTFEFTLEQPENITILINNDRNNALHILTNRPEKDKPDPEDDNVLFYEAGKTYDVGVLDLKDNQTLYLEGGAKLKGMLRVRDASHVKILGRGMIDGTDNRSEGNARFKDEPWRLIYMENARNVKVEGITLYNSLRWTIHTYDCHNLEFDHINIVNTEYGSDGIDISGCRRVRVTDSFLRTNDDCIVLKSLSFAENSHYPSPKRQSWGEEDH